MGWFGRKTSRAAMEETHIRAFHNSALAAAESYDTAQSRVEEGDVYDLFDRLRAGHLDYAGDFRKRVKQLGGDPTDRTGIAELSGRAITLINAAGSIRDLLIAMRQGEEIGVAQSREALEELDLSGKSQRLIEAYGQAHIDNLRDLSEQIALRGNSLQATADFNLPEWLRYPRAGFWVAQAALIGLGYLLGRNGSRAQPTGPTQVSRDKADWSEYQVGG